MLISFPSCYLFRLEPGRRKLVVGAGNPARSGGQEISHILKHPPAHSAQTDMETAHRLGLPHPGHWKSAAGWKPGKELKVPPGVPQSRSPALLSSPTRAMAQTQPTPGKCSIRCRTGNDAASVFRRLDRFRCPPRQRPGLGVAPPANKKGTAPR